MGTTPLKLMAEIISNAGRAGVFTQPGENPDDSTSDRYTGEISECAWSCLVWYPAEFKRVRETFGISDEAFFEESLGEIIQLGNPGKGGQGLFRTADMKYILKTMEVTEEQKLAEILPRYVEHMATQKTCLCAFVAWITVVVGGQKTPLLAMRNILPPTACGKPKLLQFDLKGSWHNRRASAREVEKGAGATLKDLDFGPAGAGAAFDNAHCRCPGGLSMAPAQREALLESICNAADFVADFGIMDHSLLLGLYDVTDVRDAGLLDAAAGCAYAEARGLRVDEAGGLLPRPRPARLLLVCGVIDVLQTFNASRRFQQVKAPPPPTVHGPLRGRGGSCAARWALTFGWSAGGGRRLAAARRQGRRARRRLVALQRPSPAVPRPLQGLRAHGPRRRRRGAAAGDARRLCVISCSQAECPTC
jgi:hypothetical protein